MAINRSDLAARLRAAREAVGLTQADAATALGLHRPAISEIEAGRRAVASEELFQLAKLYAVPVTSLLADPTPASSDIIRVLFRSDGIRTAHIRQSVQRFIERCRATRELEQLLGVAPGDDTRPAYRVSPPATRGDAIRQGNRIADEERRRLDLGREPIRDPLALLESQGVLIGELEGLESGDPIDGLYFESDDVGACVGVNRIRGEGTGFRMSFTAAHEYAHWLLRDIQVEHFDFEDRRSDQLHEVRANAFAAAFLMPEAGLRAYFEGVGVLKEGVIAHLDRADMVRAMAHFGVSRLALLWRLQNIKLLAEDQATAFRADGFSISNVARVLGIPSQSEFWARGRLPSLAVEAWRRGLLSTGRAAELYGVSIDEFLADMTVLGERQEAAGIPLIGAAAKR